MEPFVSVASVGVPLETVLESGCAGLYDYWNGIRGSRFAPTWREFELPDLPASVVRYVHVLDVKHDPFDLVVRFWGTGLTNVLYFDRTGESLFTTNMGYLDEARRNQVIEDFSIVIETREPFPFLWDASSSREHAAKLVVPSLRVPISDDGETVSHVATYFDFTDKRPDWERLFEGHARPFFSNFG